MEPLLAFIVDFWWIAPASIGAGGMGYAVATKNSRRARRLELDAARHQEGVAYRSLLAARADVRLAQANVQQAQSRFGRFTLAPDVVEAKRLVQRAKQGQRSATLALRAARTRVKSVQAHLKATGRDAPLPLERVMHEHDEITARWLSYETDALKALAFPQMSDARHPVTFTFLQSHSQAHALRPASPRAVIRPESFVAYREAVAAAGAALARAEDAARRSASTAPLGRMAQERSAAPAVPASPPRGDASPAGDPVWPVPSRRSRPAGAES